MTTDLSDSLRSVIPSGSLRGQRGLAVPHSHPVVPPTLVSESWRWNLKWDPGFPAQRLIGWTINLLGGVDPLELQQVVIEISYKSSHDH